MLEITDTIAIDEGELQFDYIRASGPGGQNVNKVSSAVQLRFDVRNSPSLTDDVRLRLELLAGKRLNADGLLVIEARRYRTQEQNRQDAIQRLATLVRKATEPPRPRKRTRPSAESRRRRLEDKHRRAEIKRLRRDPND
jgi:ribosome-associated protein